MQLSAVSQTLQDLERGAASCCQVALTIVLLMISLREQTQIRYVRYMKLHAMATYCIAIKLLYMYIKLFRMFTSPNLQYCTVYN